VSRASRDFSHKAETTPLKKNRRAKAHRHEARRIQSKINRQQQEWTSYSARDLWVRCSSGPHNGRADPWSGR
jgi:hypothetical protein